MTFLRDSDIALEDLRLSDSNFCLVHDFEHF